MHRIDGERLERPATAKTDTFLGGRYRSDPTPADTRRSIASQGLAKTGLPQHLSAFVLLATGQACRERPAASPSSSGPGVAQCQGLCSPAFGGGVSPAW